MIFSTSSRSHSGHALTIAALLFSLSATSPPVRSEEAKPESTPASDDTQHFSAPKGGLDIDIPAGWHATEFADPDLYRCIISPDEAAKEWGSPTAKVMPLAFSEPISLGVRIERTSDYTSAFGWKKTDPQTQALSELVVLGTSGFGAKGKSCVVSIVGPGLSHDQILQAIASSRAKTPDGGKGLPAVVLMRSEPTKSLPGLETFEYDVFIDYESENCIYHHVLEGAAKKQWLALDFVTTDCKRRDAFRPLFVRAVNSLEIVKKWPK